MRQRPARTILASLEQHLHDAPLLASRLSARGFAKTNHRLLDQQTCGKVRDRLPRLFRGEFDTGNYPDEWHWREGISKEHAAREICNAWKSDKTIASVVLNEDVGRFLASLKQRKRVVTLKEQWLEVLRVAKTGQAMRIYRKLDEFIQFCLKAGFID